MEITNQHVADTINMIVDEYNRRAHGTNDIDSIFKYYNDANSKLAGIYLLCPTHEVMTLMQIAIQNIHDYHIRANSRIFYQKSNTIELFSDGSYSLRTVQLSHIQSEHVDDRIAEILNYLLIL